MGQTDNEAQADELGMLAGEPVRRLELTTRGGKAVDVELREMSFSQLARLVSVAAPALAQAMFVSQIAPDAPHQVLAALLENAHDAPELLAAAAGLDPGVVGSLPATEALRLLDAVVDVQRPFFSAPAMQKVLARLFEQAGSAKAG